MHSKSEKIEKTLTFSQPKKLTINAPYYNVEFIESDEFRIEYSYNTNRDVPAISEENGAFSFVSGFSVKNNKKINIGVDLPDKSDDAATLKIYYIKDQIIESINITTELSDFNLENITTDYLKISSIHKKITLSNIRAKEINLFLELAEVNLVNIEAGQLLVKSSFSKINFIDSVISTKLNLSTEGENVNFTNFTAKNAVIKSGFTSYAGDNVVFNGSNFTTEGGNVELSGVLIGEINIKSEFTKYKFNIDDFYENYSFTIEDFTKLSVNGQRLDGSINEITKKDNSIIIDSEGSSIDFNFRS